MVDLLLAVFVVGVVAIALAVDVAACGVLVAATGAAGPRRPVAFRVLP
jgi:hypothetical protein